MTMTDENPETETEAPSRRQLTELFDKLRCSADEIARETTKEWRETIVAVADGRLTDPAAIAEIVHRTGHVPDDLDEGVATLISRSALAITLSQFPAAEATILRLRREITLLERAEQSRRCVYDDEHGALVSQRIEAVEQLSAANAARSLLVQTCSDPEALAEIENLDARMRQIPHEKKSLEIRIGDKKTSMQSWIASREQGYGADIARVRDELTQMDDAYGRLTAEANLINDSRPAVELKLLCDPEKF